ncbi:MAG TPA: Na+/H+ antiporter subunit E [Acidimicrobiales bacterium]|nr:Na+/H+ antiporter subunit E [Acidimicrobiales bacterium]
MTRVAYAVALATIWVLAWGSPSPANVLGGLVVASVLIAVAPDTWPASRRLRLRPVAAARFAAYVVAKAVESNVVITREILSRGSRIHTGVVAVELPDCSDGLLTLIANVMALTPGTMPLEVTQGPTVLYVHVLHLHDVEATRAEIRHLAALAYRAFGSAAAVAALEGAPGPGPGEVP